MGDACRKNSDNAVFIALYLNPASDTHNHNINHPFIRTVKGV